LEGVGSGDFARPHKERSHTEGWVHRKPKIVLIDRWGSPGAQLKKKEFW